MEKTHIGSSLELRAVPGTLSLIFGEDIPGLVAVTPASAVAAKSTYAMNRPWGSRRGREPRLRDQCQWRGRRPFIARQGVLFKCGRHTDRGQPRPGCGRRLQRSYVAGAQRDDDRAGHGRGNGINDGQIVQLQGPGPRARVPAHTASDRPQDLPSARLIHAGRSGRLWGAWDCSHHPAEQTDTRGGPP